MTSTAPTASATPSGAEILIAVAMIRHAARPNGLPDALAALDDAAEHDGVDPRHVALALAPMVVALRRAAGLNVEEWASFAMAAAEDWTADR